MIRNRPETDQKLIRNRPETDQKLIKNSPKIGQKLAHLWGWVPFGYHYEFHGAER